MSLSNLKQAADLTSLAVTAVGLIAKHTANKTDDKLVEYAAAIEEVLSHLFAASTGKVSIEACNLALGVLHDRLTTDDAEARKRLHDRADHD